MCDKFFLFAYYSLGRGGRYFTPQGRQSWTNHKYSLLQASASCSKIL